LERWGFARVLALTVEKIEGKEHQAMSGLVDGRAQGIEIGQELDAETSARSLLKQQIFGTVEQRRATISQLYGLGPKGRGWGQGPGRSRLSGRLVSFAIASPANRDHGADICPSPPSLWHLAVCPYRPLEFVILGTTDAAHKMVCHFRHRHTLGQSERRWFNIEVTHRPGGRAFDLKECPVLGETPESDRTRGSRR
jgi:hypothetical protein